jgi:amino acid transporter
MKNQTTHPTAKARRRLAWLLLILLALGALAMVAIPVWIVMPFKRETEEGLRLAYTLKRWSPIVTLLTAAINLALIVWLWRASRRWWSKALLIPVLLITGVSVWFARQNHFEWMFNPITEVAYSQIEDATYVEDDDKVLAVDINGEAAAYPIRQMAYHHVVNDVVGGVPITATY